MSVPRSRWGNESFEEYFLKKMKKNFYSSKCLFLLNLYTSACFYWSYGLLTN